MGERASAEQRLREAQNLAFSVELLAFCEVQRHFIESGEGEEETQARAAFLARESRRRRHDPQSILLAMRIGGCYRSGDVGTDQPERYSRYFRVLHHVLSSYYGSESRPAERRLTERKKP